MRKYAEQLKVKFGSASPTDSLEKQVVGIPGIRPGAQKKEISVRTLAMIIEARMSEIIDFVKYEILNSGYEDKMSAGIVLTGGGSQLKHLPQLVMLRTGLDARIGYPTEHLANSKEMAENLASPIFATGIGLVLNGFHSLSKYQNVSDSTEQEIEKPGKNPKKPVNPGPVRETFFSRMIKTIENKVPDMFKDVD